MCPLLRCHFMTLLSENIFIALQTCFVFFLSSNGEGIWTQSRSKTISALSKEPILRINYALNWNRKSENMMIKCFVSKLTAMILDSKWVTWQASTYVLSFNGNNSNPLQRKCEVPAAVCTVFLEIGLWDSNDERLWKKCFLKSESMNVVSIFCPPISAIWLLDLPFAILAQIRDSLLKLDCGWN